MSTRKEIVKELHKPARRNFPRRQTVVKGIHDLYQADLVEMKQFSKLNKGFKYILTVIDCFTKVAHAVPLSNKTGDSVTDAMKGILIKIKHRIKNLQTDDGTEFFNSKFTKLMSLFQINHYSTYSEKKASIIERFNRTLKSAMYKRFSERGSYVWYDILPSLIQKYNGTVHRTIGIKPLSVNKRNERLILERIKKTTKPPTEKQLPRKYFIDDQVRISKYKNIFTKGYLPNWTNEVFTVHRIQPTTPETYILKDSKGKILHGGFYGHELLKSGIGNVYLVEKILRRNKDKLLVRWLGFDKSHDSWISNNDLM